MINPIKAAKETVSVVGDVMRMAGDNPDARAAGAELAKTALTLTKTINVALLPFAAVNSSVDKFWSWYKEKFQDELAATTAQIPEEELIEPKGSIAGPAMQGLVYSHDEQNLKEMYLRLIATAMDKRVSATAHPAFVEIIKQLDSTDAFVAHHLLLTANHPIVELRRNVPEKTGYQILVRHIIDWHDGETNEPVEIDNHEAIIENLIRLGLINVSYTEHVVQEGQYDYAEKRPELERLREQHRTQPQVTVTVHRGALSRTALGIAFANAVGMGQTRPQQPLGRAQTDEPSTE